MNNTTYIMFKDLITNFAIVTSYLFLANQLIFKKRDLNEQASPVTKLIIGLITGCLGVILIMFTVKLGDTIVDFRNISIIISALFGGIPSALITGFMVFLARMFAFGHVTAPTIIAAVNTLVISLFVGIICHKQLCYWKKWAYSLLVSIVMTDVVFFINLGPVGGIQPSIIFTLMLSVGGLITAYLTNFLVRANTQLQRMQTEASTDYLTNLNNHRSFDSHFNAAVKQAQEKKEFLSLLYIDIDHFKQVNDTYGHINGDLVLAQLGAILHQTSRSFDIISRNGGEEFSIILIDCPNDHAVQIASRIRSSVENHPFILNDDSSIHITVSIGVATLSYDKPSTDLLDQADSALYAAKMGGRNRVCTAMNK